MKTMRTMAMVLFAMLFTAPAWAAGEAVQEEDLDVLMQWNDNAPPIPPTKVTQDNYLHVIGSYHNQQIKKEAYLIKEIVYADKDANYALAREKRDEGRYTLAAFYFAEALDSLKDHKWAPELCNYGIGNAFFTAGIFDGYKGKQRQYVPAVEYFKKALDANPKSRYMLDIVTKMPECYAEMSEDKLTEAEAAVKDAEERIKKYRDETGKVAQGMGYSENADKALVQLSISKAVIAEKSAIREKPGKTWQQAAALWHEARTKAKKYPEFAGTCVEGELRALIEMKDYNKAEQEANFIIDSYNKNSDYALIPQLPAAYMSLGRANMAEAVQFETGGNVPRANNSYAEARWAFLNVIVQFSGNDDYVAQAHYLSGLCYDKLKDVEKEDAQSKAIKEWQSVVANFPKSEYRDKAAKKLEGYGIKIEAPPPPAPKAADTSPPKEPKDTKKPAKGK
ncbi:MAG TPA: hypothetical protein VKX17_27855 [Planctomycetota bacterium]|nr:hypothetical protein [Planctomycetota bacterium]